MGSRRWTGLLRACALSVLVSPACFGGDTGAVENVEPAKDAAAEADSKRDGGTDASRDDAPASQSCASDRVCTPMGKLCHPQLARCAECVEDGDCDDAKRCDMGDCHARVACENSLDCVGTSDALSICDQGLGECVQCTSSSDCEGMHVCAERSCVASADCQGTADCGGGAGSATGGMGASGVEATGGAGAGASGMEATGGVGTAGMDGSGGMGGSGGNPAVCPMEPPVNLGTCTALGATCSYGDRLCVCSIFWTCGVAM